MKLPRDISGTELIKALQRIGYQVTRQTGSHIRLSSHSPETHHITIPNHNPLRIGTLSAILSDVAAHRNIERDALIRQLFPGSTT